MAKKKEEPEVIVIEAPRYQEILVQIRGKAPGLLCDRITEEAREGLKKKGAAKKPKDKNPEEDPMEVLKKCYTVSEKGKVQYGLPSGAFLRALATVAADLDGVFGTTINRNLTIVPDNEEGLILFDKIDGPRLVEHCGRNRSKALITVRRPCFREWTMNVPIEFDAGVFSVESVLHIMAHAGMKVGVGAWRKENRGPYGRWEVVGLKG